MMVQLNIILTCLYELKCNLLKKMLGKVLQKVLLFLTCV